MSTYPPQPPRLVGDTLVIPLGDTAAPPARAAGPDLVHMVCCDEDTAACGEDVTTQPFTPEPVTCRECLAVAWEGLKCERCGEPYGQAAP